MINDLRRIQFLVLILFVSDCSDKTYLISTPAINIGQQGRETFDHVSPELRKSEMTILYAADRASVQSTLLGKRYSDGRADHLVFGSATITIKPDVSWDQLVNACTSRKRDQEYWLESKTNEEHGELAISLERMEVREGRYRLPEAALKDLSDSKERMHKIIAEALSHT